MKNLSTRFNGGTVNDINFFCLCLANACFNQIDGNNCLVKTRVEAFLKLALGGINE